MPNLMILDPELIKCILVRDFDHFVDRTPLRLRSSPYVYNMLITLAGSEWKNVRAGVSPTFTTGKIKAMLPLVTTCAQQLVNHFNTAIMSKSTGPVDAKDVLSKYTLDVIASCAFGVQCDSLKDKETEFFREISMFNDIPLWKRMLLFAIIIIQLPNFITERVPLSFMNDRTVNFLANVVKETTKIRKEKNIRRNDFLQLLMDSEKIDNPSNGTSSGPGRTMSEEVMIAQSVLFFIAGYETSSTELSMACYLLAKNQAIQNKLRQEIRDVLHKYSGEITYESINDMPYMDMVLAETLRMYPPVARLDRSCVEDYCLARGVTVDKGIRVNIPVIGLHYDPEYYPEPERFDPERFSVTGKANRSPYVYLPFGAGPRNCIGLRFAQMTTKMCMVYILQDFSVDICEKTEENITYSRKSMLLKAENGVWLQFLKLKKDL
ncbi:hypothetical protein AAG570_009952 [Ranatra chinensis]|uniref:Cytochrome P450 n=1 Tax=Ranatra chinensis TaxID=642074 RepID=A0ABD0ZBT1_9HEMI